MYLSSSEGRSLHSPSFAAYLLMAIRLGNGIAMLLPALVLAWLFDISSSRQSLQVPVSMVLLNGLLGILIFQALGLYGAELFSNKLQFRKILGAWAIIFGLILFANALFGLAPGVPISFWMIWFISSFLLLVLQRIALLGFFRYLMKQRFFLQNTVILGCNSNGIRLAQYLKENGDIRSGLIGFIDDRNVGRLPLLDNEIPFLGAIDDLVRLVREEKIHQILVALPWSAVSRLAGLSDTLKRLPVNVLLAPEMEAFRYAHNRVTQISGLPMFNISELPLSGWSSTLKRLEDLILSSVVLLLASPLMLLIAILVKLDSPGPLIFRQKRYGYNNKLIEVYKFRTMHQAMTDADAERQTIKHDSRVTRVGKILRRTSLDELPQFFNVLFGSMSVVGPRPHAKATKAAGVLFEDALVQYTSRHRVKPGITGWAQVNNCRGETDTLAKLERRIELDLEYIEAWSVWFDLYIIVRTIPAVLFTREAY